MDKIYLNELSLAGQFKDMEGFLDASIPLMKCLKLIQKHQGKIYKQSTFYKRTITRSGKTLNDLRGVYGDKARKLKSLLLGTTDSPPFWDTEENRTQDQAADYICNGEKVGETSIAEAAENQAMLLSFLHSEYEDRNLKVLKNGKLLASVASAVNPAYLAEELWKNRQIIIKEFLCVKYDGTRLNFTKLDEEYGLEQFEAVELKECLEAFQRFVSHDNWNDILTDRSLCYKKYSPSEKEKDWFNRTEYRDYAIDKFRCGNPKRCFGYRENDVFYVLRMERDHSISDNG